MTTFRFQTETVGGHVHVKVRTGTAAQADAGRLPLAGTLTLPAEQWEALWDLLRTAAATLRHFDRTSPVVEVQAREPQP